MKNFKQWDAIKFHHIQTLEGHTDHIDSLAISANGRLLVFTSFLPVHFWFFLFSISASRDKSIRVWELTDEIIVLREEEEKEREKEYEQKMIGDDDIVSMIWLRF